MFNCWTNYSLNPLVPSVYLIFFLKRLVYLNSGGIPCSLAAIHCLNDNTLYFHCHSIRFNANFVCVKPSICWKRQAIHRASESMYLLSWDLYEMLYATQMFGCVCVCVCCASVLFTKIFVKFSRVHKVFLIFAYKGMFSVLVWQLCWFSGGGAHCNVLGFIYQSPNTRTHLNFDSWLIMTVWTNNIQCVLIHTDQIIVIFILFGLLPFFSSISHWCHISLHFQYFAKIFKNYCVYFLQFNWTFSFLIGHYLILRSTNCVVVSDVFAFLRIFKFNIYNHKLFHPI